MMRIKSVGAAFLMVPLVVASPARAEEPNYTSVEFNTPGATIPVGANFQISGYFQRSIIKGPDTERVAARVVDAGTLETQWQALNIMTPGTGGDRKVQFDSNNVGVGVIKPSVPNPGVYKITVQAQRYNPSTMEWIVLKSATKTVTAQ